jgi:hypothetical protein
MVLVMIAQANMPAGLVKGLNMIAQFMPQLYEQNKQAIF